MHTIRGDTHRMFVARCCTTAHIYIYIYTYMCVCVCVCVCVYGL